MAKHTIRTLRQSTGARTKHGLRGQRGSTLVGELIALTIMGVTLVIFMSGLSTTSSGVGLIEQRVSAENYARQQMELVKAAAYQPNPTAAPYPTVAVRCPESAPACTPVYSVQTDVTYWHEDTQSFASTQPSPDTGLQRVSVQVYSAQRPGLPVFSLEGFKTEVMQP